MIKEAMEWLSTIKQGKPEEIDGRKYWAAPGRHLEPIIPPAPGALPFSSLTGLADYVDDDPDRGSQVGTGAFIHVVDEVTVHYISPLISPWLSRFLIAKACVEKLGMKDQCKALSEMILYIRTHFHPTQERTDLLNVLSAIVADEKSQQFVDDGVSQQVTVKSGVASLKRMDMPGDVSLVPLGGFAEVMQPPVDYVLRLQKGREEPTVILAPMVSPTYALDYMVAIRSWLIDGIERQVKVML
jgi:hypothetical protein